jgi:hypothetical protein
MKLVLTEKSKKISNKRQIFSGDKKIFSITIQTQTKTLIFHR